MLQGRLIDHLRNTQSVGLEDLQALVLDEADRLLEMGFTEEVCTIDISTKHISTTFCSAQPDRSLVQALDQMLQHIRGRAMPEA